MKGMFDFYLFANLRIFFPQISQTIPFHVGSRLEKFWPNFFLQKFLFARAGRFFRV